MNHKQEMELARQLLAQSSKPVVTPVDIQVDDWSDLEKCLIVRKTHISHLRTRYVLNGKSQQDME